MKFQWATEFTRVPPDLNTLLYTNTWFSVYCFHCIYYVQTESNTARWQLCSRGKRGQWLIEGKAAELYQNSSGHWTRLPKWKLPECRDVHRSVCKYPCVSYTLPLKGRQDITALWSWCLVVNLSGGANLWRCLSEIFAVIMCQDLSTGFGRYMQHACLHAWSQFFSYGQMAALDV
jgi:hypothetical protein